MKSKFQRQLVEARRAQILEAAIAVIAEQGFQQTTIKQIAAKAEVADGTIYNYFKNKDDILMAIIADISEAEVRELHFAEAERVDYSVFVREYTAHRMQEVAEGYPVLKVVIAETLANPALTEQVYAQIYGPAFAVAEQFFARLVATGAVPAHDPALLARLFAAPLLGLLVLRMFGDKHVEENWQSYSEFVGESLAKFFDGVATPAQAALDKVDGSDKVAGKPRVKKKRKKS